MTPIFRAHLDLKVVRLLVENGAGKDLTNDSGETALMLAARDGYVEVVRFLVDNGAGMDLTSDNGETGLMLAAYYGHEDVVHCLLEAGVDKDSCCWLVGNGGIRYDASPMYPLREYIGSFFPKP